MNYDKINGDVLHKLSTDPASCVQKLMTNYSILIHPMYFPNVKKGIIYELNALVKNYSMEFGGYVMGYENIQLLATTGWLFTTNPYIHVPVHGTFYIFKPKVDSILKGVAKKKSMNHIGGLVHEFFNISATRPPNVNHDKWCGTYVQENEEIMFKIKSINLKGNMPLIRADLIPDSVNQFKNPDVCSPNKKIVFSDEDSGISIHDLEENPSENTSKKKRKLSFGEADLEDNSAQETSKKKKKKKRQNEADFEDIPAQETFSEYVRGMNDQSEETTCNQSEHKKKKKKKKNKNKKDCNGDLTEIEEDGPVCVNKKKNKKKGQGEELLVTKIEEDRPCDEYKKKNKKGWNEEVLVNRMEEDSPCGEHRRKHKNKMNVQNEELHEMEENDPTRPKHKIKKESKSPKKIKKEIQTDLNDNERIQSSNLKNNALYSIVNNIFYESESEEEVEAAATTSLTETKSNLKINNEKLIKEEMFEDLPLDIKEEICPWDEELQ